MSLKTARQLSTNDVFHMSVEIENNSVWSAIIDHGQDRPAAERTVLGIFVNIQRCRDRGHFPYDT